MSSFLHDHRKKEFEYVYRETSKAPYVICATRLQGVLKNAMN